MNKKFQHDCDKCLFLGSFISKDTTENPENLDLYFCKNERFSNLSSVIARFGNDGPEYYSCHLPSLFEIPPPQIKYDWYQYILDELKQKSLYHHDDSYEKIKNVLSDYTNEIISENEVLFSLVSLIRYNDKKSNIKLMTGLMSFQLFKKFFQVLEDISKDNIGNYFTFKDLIISDQVRQAIKKYLNWEDL